MKGYKGFEKRMICKGKQYKENTVFTEKEAEICEKGMHFCARPIDVLEFYAPTDKNGELQDFAEVESLASCKTDDDIKYCTQKLKIGVKIGLVGLINAEVEYVKNTLIPEVSKAINNVNAAVNSGYRSAAVNSGDRSAAVNSGTRSAAVNSGTRSAAEVSGEESIAIALGIEGKAKAKKGSWITLAEWKEKNNEWHRIRVKTIKVDGKKIKEDTFYRLENGKFIEVVDD